MDFWGQVTGWIKQDPNIAAMEMVIIISLFVFFGSIKKTGKNKFLFSDDSRKEKLIFFQKIGLLPKYDELSLSLIVLICALLFLFCPPFDIILKGFFNDGVLRLIFGVAVFFIIYYSFSSKMIPGALKGLVLFPIVSVNFLVAAEAWKNLQDGSRFLLFLPFFNLIGASFALVAVGGKRGDEVAEEVLLPDKNARIPEIVIGSAAVGIIFFLSNFVFQNHWTITFSICLTYSLMVNGMIVKYLFKGKKSPV